MKLHFLVAASLLAAVAALPFGAQAAPSTEKGSGAEMQGEKSMGKKMKPHSHMEEKNGMTPKAAGAMPEQKSDKPKVGKDKTKHYHPRDGK